MQRFYFSRQLNETERFEDEKFHQISRVLRYKVGDEMILFSDFYKDDPEEWVYEIIEFTKKSVILQKKSRIKRESPENSKYITLFQALPNKLEKIEWILAKNIEIGVQKFVFFRSERSQKLILSDSKKKRLYEIAREALEQSGGVVFPEIIFCEKGFNEILVERVPQNILLHTQDDSLKFSAQDLGRDIGIWVGPEGGWSDDEIKKMNNYSFITAHFGKRIMRTETAGLCVAFYINHL